MAQSEDTHTSMSYMDHVRAVALAGVAVIVEKTRTYGPSWKRRGGPGAWFTTVRPWDRLETIVERHGGDVLAAVAADPSGADGSALGCLRDIRNYTILIEAEMVARGVVESPLVETDEDHMTNLKTALQRLFGMGAPFKIERLIQNDAQTMTLALHFAAPTHSSIHERQAGAQETILQIVGTQTEVRDAAEPTRSYVSQDPPTASRPREWREGRMGAGAVDRGRYTILDLGHGADLWHVGLGAMPWIQAMEEGARETAQAQSIDKLRRMFGPSILIASRPLEGGGHQVLVRTPD